MQDKIEWEALMPQLMTHAMWHVRVPAGGSTGGHAAQLRDAATVVMLGRTVNETTACARVGKILACTLRRNLTREPARAGGLTPLAALEALLNLLAHYFHAGNAGGCALRLRCARVWRPGAMTLRHVVICRPLCTFACCSHDPLL